MTLDPMARQAAIDIFEIEWKINKRAPLEALDLVLDALASAGAGDGWQMVWVQHVIAHIEGTMPLDEKWKAICLNQLRDLPAAPLNEEVKPE